MASSIDRELIEKTKDEKDYLSRRLKDEEYKQFIEKRILIILIVLLYGSKKRVVGNDGRSNS